jgi:DNA-binding response OmpR family regulator
MTPNGFTPTERAMLQVLHDGKLHTRAELHACLPDELAPLRAIQFHISRLRAKLRPHGHDIICGLLHGRIISYQHVLTLRTQS